MPRLSKIGAAALAAFGWTGLSSVTASYLVVAGGGAGGGASSGTNGGGGGGGAGGFRTGTESLNPTLSYAITVGGGGAGGAASGATGSNSVFSSTTSNGGGGGGAASANGANGGSGGGGGAQGAFSATSGGTGNTPSTSPSQGNNGGGSTATTNGGGGGGGGSGGAGSATSTGTGGAGGAGTANSITGSSVTYAAGGVGGNGSGSSNGAAGTANTGNGGGGGNQASGQGGNGGAGVVIISYVGAQQFGGGVVTSSGGNTIHTFTTSGTLSPLSSLTANFLVIAGGGAGGNQDGGGGGAGGYRTSAGTSGGGASAESTLTIDTNSIYLVTVGAGGTTNASATGGNGSNSSFFSITSTGGGGGGYSTPATGGSGGGGRYGFNGAAGTANQGYAGGAGGPASGVFAAGGGGGASAVGATGGATGGNGGAGVASSIRGSSVTYAGGGGGGTFGGTNGTGGSGGGGNAGSAGTANTGGGGGGGFGNTDNGGAGGSGIVIISYPGSTQQMAGGTVTVAGGNVIHTFTSSGYLTPIVLVNNSLRFRSSASAYLNRTPAGSPTSTQKFTQSYWVKRGTLSTTQYIYNCEPSDWVRAYIFSDNIFYFDIRVSGTNYSVGTTQVFRDPSAWYHIVVSVDTTQATAANRVIIYVNGVQAPTNTPTIPQNSVTVANSANPNFISAYKTPNQYFDGYLTEVNFIDGQALTPNSFGTFNGLGVWQPIRYGGSYGTNGFYLPFTNTTSTTTLGYDFSPNGNNWTTNNISLTAGSTYDSMTDVPTLTSTTAANYCVLNPIQRYDTSSAAGVYSSGNLIVASGGIPTQAFGTMAIPSGSTAGFYWEGVCTSMDASRTYIGIVCPTDGPDSVGAPYAFNTKGVLARTGDYYQTQTNGTSDGTYTSYTTNDVVMVAYKNGKIWFGKNGTWMNSGNPAADTGAISTTLSTSKDWFPYFGYNSTWSTNFGQRPFSYTPPTGFNRLNTFNLPTPTIGATPATQANRYFDAVTRNGFGSSGGSVTSLNFQPDFWWEKARNTVSNHTLIDSIRGVTKELYSNLTNAESTGSNFLVSFNSNGFTMGSNDWGTSTTLVDWVWNAGGSTVTNTSGSISSQVRANTTAGFSIVTYTGNGTAGSTIGHGLGVAPRMIFGKNRTSGTPGWPVYHASVGNTGALILNSTTATDVNSAYWNNTSPTSSVFSIGTGTSVNTSTQNYVMYCFAEVAGYSAFGSYTGNGSTNGPFIFTGFRPRFILMKASSAVEQWTIWDSSRLGYNPFQAALFPNASSAEDATASGANSNGGPDFLSNGFKMRSNGGSNNNNGVTYIYMAFAESPFKYANAR